MFCGTFFHIYLIDYCIKYLKRHSEFLINFLFEYTLQYSSGLKHLKIIFYLFRPLQSSSPEFPEFLLFIVFQKKLLFIVGSSATAFMFPPVVKLILGLPPNLCSVNLFYFFFALINLFLGFLFLFGFGL